MHINIREIDHVVIRCADLDNMVNFYRTCCAVPSKRSSAISV